MDSGDQFKKEEWVDQIPWLSMCFLLILIVLDYDSISSNRLLNIFIKTKLVNIMYILIPNWWDFPFLIARVSKKKKIKPVNFVSHRMSHPMTRCDSNDDDFFVWDEFEVVFFSFFLWTTTSEKMWNSQHDVTLLHLVNYPHTHHVALNTSLYRCGLGKYSRKWI